MQMAFGAICLQNQLHKSSQTSETCAFQCYFIILLFLDQSLRRRDRGEISRYLANLRDQDKFQMVRCLTQSEYEEGKASSHVQPIDYLVRGCEIPTLYKIPQASSSLQR